MIGNFQWMQQTDGQLSLNEKVKLINKIMLPSMLALLKTHLRIGQTDQQLKIEDFIIPDTPMVKAAIVELENKTKTDIALLNHSWRTYFWGAALGKIEQRDFDPELLITAALFHDIGLTERHIHHKGCQCFTYTSALAFEKTAQSINYDINKSEVIKDAICLHMNGYTDQQHPAEVILLQQGAACDVIGDQFFRLPHIFRQDILQAYPREDFNSIFRQLLNTEAQNVKNSRTALLKQLGLTMMIRMNPFQE